MHPFFNMFPHNPNQVQAGGLNNGSAAPQVMPSDLGCSNPNGLLSKSSQTQTQMGFLNPHNAIPFNNCVSHLNNLVGNAIAMPNHNHLLPLQTNVPLLSQVQGGFSSQICLPFCNSGPNSSQINQFQPRGQFMHSNPVNLAQNFNQNVALPNGQFYFQNPIQDMNHFIPMQMPNLTQGVGYNVPPPSNQMAQAMGSQNPNFVPNKQFCPFNTSGVAQPFNHHQNKLIPPAMGVNSPKLPFATHQAQGNTPSSFTRSVRPQQTQKNQSASFLSPQGNDAKIGGVLNSNLNTSRGRNFTRHPKREQLHWGTRNSQFNHMQNLKRKMGNFNDKGGKGTSNHGTRKSGLSNSTSHFRAEKRRSPAMNYSEQEIKLWREERKKNYPSEGNIEKKQKEKLMNFEIINRDAKLRRQQLKEILAKQAELGVEVAEVPPHYLSDTEEPVHGNGEDNNSNNNKRAWTKKEKFQNRLGKKGKRGRKGRFSKRQRLEDNNSGSTPALNKKKTLLQKLLSKDVKRDKSHLLQVFCFMATNSFFKDWPNEALKFPLFVVRDSGDGNEGVVEKSSGVGPSFPDDDVEDHALVGKHVKGKELTRQEIGSEDGEEGEIID